MRRNRFIWLGFLILALVGITCYGGPVSYGFLATVVLIPISSIIYISFVALCFRIYQKIESKTLVVGAAYPFYITLKNEFFFAFSSIKITLFSDFSYIEGMDDSIEYELFPSDKIDYTTKLVCCYRGDYYVGIKEVVIQDFFRLFKYTYTNSEKTKVTVKPRMVYIENIKNVDLNNIMSKDSLFHPSVPDIIVREYIAGDDVRQMNWKSTARSGKLMVRRYIGEEKQRVGIILDTRRFGKEQIEFLPVENKMLELSVALGLYMAGKNVPVSLWHGSETMSETNISSLLEFDYLYETLSNVGFAADEDGQELMSDFFAHKRIMDCRIIFFVIHEWNEKFEKIINTLNENNIYVLVCVVREKTGEKIKLIKGNNVDFIEIDLDSNLMEAL